MRFIHGDDAYRLEFTREWQEVAVPVRPKDSPGLKLARDVFQYYGDLNLVQLSSEDRQLRDQAAEIMATEGGSPIVSRPRTTVMLHREVTNPSPIDPQKTEMSFVEIGHASVRFYHKDVDETRETGRRLALRRLCPFIPMELRPLVWKAYLERPRPKEAPKPIINAEV